AVLAPAAHFITQPRPTEQQCDSAQGSGCAAQPRGTQFTLLAATLEHSATVSLLPAGVGTLKGAAGLGNTVSALRGANTTGQPCHSATLWVAHLSNWATPPGCYATIFAPNPSNYSADSTFGYCNWWVEALHPNRPDILSNRGY